MRSYLLPKIVGKWTLILVYCTSPVRHFFEPKYTSRIIIRYLDDAKQIILSVYQSFCITSNYNWHCDSFQTTSCFFWKGIGLLKREPILVRIRTQDTVTWVTGMDFYQEAISKSSTWFFLLTFSSSHRRMWFISDLPPIAAWCIP